MANSEGTKWSLQISGSANPVSRSKGERTYTTKTKHLNNCLSANWRPFLVDGLKMAQQGEKDLHPPISLGGKPPTGKRAEMICCGPVNPWAPPHKVAFLLASPSPNPQKGLPSRSHRHTNPCSLSILRKTKSPCTKRPSQGLREAARVVLRVPGVCPYGHFSPASRVASRSVSVS